MHDGRFKTLEEVVDFYDRGGIEASRYNCAPGGTAIPGIAGPVRLPGFLPRLLRGIVPNVAASSPSEIHPLDLGRGEKRDLVEFLKSLTGEGWRRVETPITLPD